MSQRVIVIGLDGGAWHIFDPYIDAGLMPNLKRLCTDGYRSDLTSTIPAITPTAWSTFATGCNPGKHGVFGFIAPQKAPGSYCAPLPRRDDIAMPTLWRRLSDHGLTSIVLGVPLTYPPEPINGALVTGMFTPSLDSPCTHPQDLKAELLQHDCMPAFDLDCYNPDTGGLTIEQACADNYAGFFDDLHRTTDRLARTALHLIDRPWQFFMTMFITTDRLHHLLYDRIIAEGPQGDSLLAQRIRTFYSHLDDVLGQLLDATGPAAAILMSDHGFGPCLGQYNCAHWFQDNGYASYRKRRSYNIARNIISKLGLRNLLLKHMPRRTLARVMSTKLPQDWSHTQAYLTFGGIQINLKGREAQGIVEPDRYDALRHEIRQKLHQLADPNTHAPLIGATYFPEEIYHGPHTRWARDIIFTPADNPCYEFHPGKPDAPLIEPLPTFRGEHRPEGIFLAAGDTIANNPAAPAAHIMDICPTILTLLGLPVPTDIDGQTILPALAQSPTPAAPTPPSTDTQPTQQPQTDYDPEEEEALTERLRNIGYM